MHAANVVTLTGRIGRDAEVKTFQNGGCVIEWSMATSETWKDRESGEKKEKTTWHECKKHVKSDGLARLILKGHMIHVLGSITVEEWEKDGKKNRKTVIRVEDVTLLDNRGVQEGGGQSQGSGGGGGGGYGDDDIPF